MGGCVSVALETWHFLHERHIQQGHLLDVMFTMHLNVLKPWTDKDGLIDKLILMFLYLTFFKFDAIALRLTKHS